MLSLIFLIGFAFDGVLAVKLADLDSLRLVHVLWRHGDRSPAKPTFPTDTGNPVNSWPQGWGELSIEGMRQQFQLGRWLRQRYEGFLSNEYSAYEIHVRSTTYNRTLMSAMANLAGFFYPPTSNEQFHPNISWFPVPIHSVPSEIDSVLPECKGISPLVFPKIT